MNYQVRITRSAARDIDTLATYLLEEAGATVMKSVLSRLQKRIASFSTNPQRGSNPRDILALVSVPRKQLVIKPYRVIYQIADHRVYIEMVVDSRRDTKEAFMRRLQSGF